MLKRGRFAYIKTYLSPDFPMHLAQRWLCGRGQYAQSGDERQDFGEHLSRHRDLSHLEGDVAAVADDLRADLDQLLAQLPERARDRQNAACRAQPPAPPRLQSSVNGQSPAKSPVSNYFDEQTAGNINSAQ
jgi:hypothetical protein